MTDPIPMSVLQQFADGAGFSLNRHAIYACYVGSKAHNTYVPKDDPGCIDDIDVTVVVVPPRRRVYGLHPWDKSRQIQIDEWDVTVHALPKFVSLCLKGNPNVLSTLWPRPEDVLRCAPAFRPFVEHRDAFSSRRVVNAFLGYANGQFQKMTGSQAFEGYMGAKRKALVEKYGYDCKNAAHLLRLLRMCSEFCDDGQLRVWRTDDAQEIRDIKSGKWPVEQVMVAANALFAEVNGKLPRSPLPETPNEALADDLLCAAVEASWETP